MATYIEGDLQAAGKKFGIIVSVSIPLFRRGFWRGRWIPCSDPGLKVAQLMWSEFPVLLKYLSWHRKWQNPAVMMR